MNKTNFPTELFSTEKTPFYFYDLSLLDATLTAVKEAAPSSDYWVHYAVKANANPVILRHIAEAGLGADTVSIGEIHAAVDAGFPAHRIVFAGVGKTDEEIRTALELGIGCFNVESEAELEVIEEIASEMKMIAPVALRVNPNIDAHTHHYITTGLAENKFGIDHEMLPAILQKCISSPFLQFKGLHFHIGSQITDLTPYKILCERILKIQDEYPELFIPTINVGGGLGIDYDDPDANPIPDFQSYFDIFRENLPLKPGQELHFELGRAIVAQCGSLICKVVFVKEGMAKKFIILDGGMAALIRPALYQAHHKIENITSTSSIMEKYDVVGPICESSDTFGEDEILPLTKRGDYIAIRSAGAYGEVMASCYNCRPLPSSFYSL